MKHFALIFSFCMSFSCLLHAQETTQVLNELDEVISNKAYYTKIAQTRIDSLKHLLKSAKDSEKFAILEQLYNNYSIYQVDSALYYINVWQKLPSVKGDRYKSILVNLKKAVIYGIMGDFCSATQIVDTIDIADAPDNIRTEYFHTCRTVYGWNSEYVKGRHERNEQLERITQIYRDSIITHTQPGVRRSNVVADNCIVNRDADAAINILLEVIPQAQSAQKIYAYYNLAQCYKLKGNYEQYVRYLAITAICDIKSGVKEYKALPELASFLYEKGDMSRAYTYLFCSLEDAYFCNAFLRTFEVNNVFPIIDKEYREQQQRDRLFEQILLIGVSAFSILLIIGLFYLRKQMKRMKVIRKKLADTNSELASANDKLELANTQLQGFNSQLGENNVMLTKANDDLEITNKIKEEYIAHYLEVCRELMDVFEKHRKKLLKLAKGNQFQEMMKLLKSDEIMESEQRKFYSDFDKSFLSLYPNFIEQFNSLLQPEFQLAPRKGELLSTELRIFALIRLGVDDTAMIAHFLNCSLPTVYNYRSRIRNNSPLGKDEFYSRFMAIK